MYNEQNFIRTVLQSRQNYFYLEWSFLWNESPVLIMLSFVYWRFGDHWWTPKPKGKWTKRKSSASWDSNETFQVTLYVSEHPTSWGVRTFFFFCGINVYKYCVFLDVVFLKIPKRIDFKREGSCFWGSGVVATAVALNKWQDSCFLFLLKN
jgi:hypothetical protein